MVHDEQEVEHYNNSTWGVLLGVLVGGLAGALTMLLMAPQSGKDTRTQIQKKGIELRDRTSEMMQDTMGQMRLDRSKIVMGGRQKTQELLHQGQALAVEQLDRVSKAAQAGKKAIQSA